jgi:hypothetical protein
VRFDRATSLKRLGRELDPSEPSEFLDRVWLGDHVEVRLGVGDVVCGWPQLAGSGQRRKCLDECLVYERV